MNDQAVKSDEVIQNGQAVQNDRIIQLDDNPIVFFCKDCEEIAETVKVGGKYVYKCKKCGTKNVAFGTKKSIYGFFRIEEREKEKLREQRKQERMNQRQTLERVKEKKEEEELKKLE